MKREAQQQYARREKRLAGRAGDKRRSHHASGKSRIDPREQRNTETAAHARINARKEMTAAPSHIQAHGRDRQFEDPCRQKNERAGFRPIRHKLVSLNLAGKQHVGQNGSDSTHDKTRRRRLCDNGERSISHTSRQTREQRRRPLEYKGERIPEGDARKKPNRVERPGRRLGETRQSARASEKRRGCRSPAQRCERRAEIQHRFRRAAQLVFVRIGRFVRRLPRCPPVECRIWPQRSRRSLHLQSLRHADPRA